MKCKKIMALALSAVLAAGMLAGCCGSSSGGDTPPSGGTVDTGLSGQVAAKIENEDIRTKIAFKDDAALNAALSQYIDKNYINNTAWTNNLTNYANFASGLEKLDASNAYFWDDMGGSTLVNSNWLNDDLKAGVSGTYAALYMIPPKMGGQDNTDIIAGWFNDGAHKNDLLTALNVENVKLSAAIATQTIEDVELSASKTADITLVAIAITVTNVTEG